MSVAVLRVEVYVKLNPSNADLCMKQSDNYIELAQSFGWMTVSDELVSPSTFCPDP